MTIQDHIGTMLHRRNAVRRAVNRIEEVPAMCKPTPTVIPAAHLLHDMGHYGEAQALSQNPAENPLRQALRRARDDAEEVAVRNGMHPDVLAYIRAQKFTGPEGVA